MRLRKKRADALKSAFEQRTTVKWEDLIKGSSEVVLFGSWAIEGESDKSDIDLLCVDYPRRIRSTSVDIVNYPSNFLRSKSWLTSELGVHIAHYGIWLKGKGAWRRSVKITPETLLRKKEQILVRAARLSCTLTLTESKAVRSREVVRLRRDLQRYKLLEKNMATAPSALLDKCWEGSKIEQTECASLLRQIACNFYDRQNALAEKLI